MNRVDETKGGTDEMLAPVKESAGSYSPLQLHFVRRLNRLLRLRGEQLAEVNAEGLRLIDRAIYSTYCDTVDLGVGAEAQKLLHRFAVSAKSNPAAG